MELGSTLSGVPIQISRWGVSSTPAMVITTPAARPKATVVCTANRTFASSRAP
jgi:hypothetical protein